MALNNTGNTTQNPTDKLDNVTTEQQPLPGAQPGHCHPNGGNGESTATATAQLAQWACIPQELRDRPQWCVARADKAPLTATLHLASSTDPLTWTDFYTACRAANANGQHIGYMLSPDDPYTCIDLDVKEGITQEEIEGFDNCIGHFDSYTEHSRSGKGYHIFLKGNIGKGIHKKGVEVYSQERFIICTGNVVINKPIEERQDSLDKFAQYLREDKPTADPLPDAPQTKSDEVILQRLRNAANADKFNAHYSGNFSAIGHIDHSKADMALIQMMAFYTQNNAQLKRLFLGSALGQRDKAAVRKDYVDRTIANIRSIQAQEPNAAHGAQVAVNIITSAWLKAAHPQCAPASASQLRLIGEEEMANRPHVRWRIRDVLPEKGLVAVYGPPSSGKSFLVLGMLAAISTGNTWFGNKVRPAPVVYVALEGKAGISQRIKAHHEELGPMNEVKFIDAPMDLRLPEHRANLITVIREAGWDNGVLCIDTLAASAPGMDENTSTDMGKLIAGLQEIQEALDCCVVVVHHTGKDQGRGLRGWSGLTGAVDGAIEVTSNETYREWKIVKAKDGRDGYATKFELKPVFLYHDEDGEPVSSCVVKFFEPEESDEETTDKVLALIREYYDRGEYIAPANNARNRAYNVLKEDSQYPQGLSNKALTTLLREAERAGLIEVETYKNPQRNTAKRWKVT